MKRFTIYFSAWTDVAIELYGGQSDGKLPQVKNRGL